MKSSHELLRKDTEMLANYFWHIRGCSEGTAVQDWLMAEQILLTYRAMRVLGLTNGEQITTSTKE